MTGLYQDQTKPATSCEKCNYTRASLVREPILTLTLDSIHKHKKYVVVVSVSPNKTSCENVITRHTENYYIDKKVVVVVVVVNQCQTVLRIKRMKCKSLFQFVSTLLITDKHLKTTKEYHSKCDWSIFHNNRSHWFIQNSKG